MSQTRAAEGSWQLDSAPWQRGADRLARYGWMVLVAAVVAAVLGSILSAAIGGGAAPPGPAVEECTNPPCWGGGGMPTLGDLGWVLATLGYGLAVLLGLPSLAAALWDFARSRLNPGTARLLAFIGPVLVLIGTEIIPHLMNPCYFALQIAGRRFPSVCEYAEWGTDFGDRWHLANHTLVGAIPLVLLYGLAIRKWRFDAAAFLLPGRGAEE